MVNDRLLPEFHFSNHFSVAYPSRDLWSSQDFLNKLDESIVFFSDGSRSNLSAGFGIYCAWTDLRLFGSLGSHCTVFQAELIALTRSVIEALNFAFKNKSILLCTDSKAVLNSLRNPLTVSKLVKECKHFMNLLCSNNKVTVMWVPAHCDIVGNEIADCLAKAGSQLTFVGPEPAVPVSFNYGKKVMKDYALKDLRSQWLETFSCRKAKYFIKEPNLRSTKYALSLKKNQLRILVAILTGHGRFKDHLHRMRLAHDVICEDCLEEDDDCLHFVSSCPAFSSIRIQIFNFRSLNLDQLSSLPWSKLVQFAKAAVRVCELG